MTTTPSNPAQSIQPSTEHIKPLGTLGWACLIVGGFLLGASIGGRDFTIAAALFYAVSVFAFTARAALEPEKPL